MSDALYGEHDLGRLKMQEWKMQEYRLAVWKAKPRLYSETALSYLLKIVLRLLIE